MHIRVERLLASAVGLLATLPWTLPSQGAGLESIGNTDGVLTWQLGTVAPGKCAREVVLFVFDQSVDAARDRLQAVRARFANAPEAPAHTAPATPEGKVWITNGTTDFALEGAGFFRWRLQRQSLAGAQGGQLSQVAWYVNYSDKALWRVQSLWTTGQDGTGTRVFWGNQSVWPDHLAEPRPIPGSRRVMFTGVGHHDWFSGSIGIIDPDRGLNFPHGLTKVTRDLRWPECSLPPVDPGESEQYHPSGAYTGYLSP